MRNVFLIHLSVVSATQSSSKASSSVPSADESHCVNNDTSSTERISASRKRPLRYVLLD